MNHSTVRSDSRQIATISFKYKIAQRKFSDRVVWERLQSDSPLYDGDTIRTADLAQATIKFSNGASLDLSENTMLQVFYSEDGNLHVSVNDGNVSVDTTASKENVALDMTGVSVNLESGSRIVAKTAEPSKEGVKSGASLQVVAGNAEVTGEKGEKQEIKKGETAKVEEGGKVTRKPVSVSLPADYKVLDFDGNKTCDVKMELSVPEKKAGDKVIIQTSKTKNFSKIEKTYTAENVESAQIKADEGVTYWRVSSAEDSGNFTEGKILVESVPAVTGKSPVFNAEYFYRSEKPAVSFSWNGNEYASKYRLEISKNADFSNNVVDSELTSQSTTVKGLGEGKYWWRVTPFYSSNNMGFYGSTKPASFTVTKREAYLKPVLTLPSDNGKFIYDGVTFDASFAWKTEVKGAETKVLISKDPEFKNILREIPCEKKSLDTVLSISDVPQGKYWWRVTQNFTDDLDGTKKFLESEIRSFTVSKYVPEKSRLIYPKDGFTVEESALSDLNFMWKLTSEETENIVLQVSSSKDFKKPVFEKKLEKTDSEIKNLSLKEGSYFWRLKTERKRLDGTTGFEYTDAWNFTVLGKLGTPSILSPAQNALRILPEGQKLEAVWTKVKDADYYKVQLSDVSTGKVIDEKTVEGSPSVLLNSGLSAGGAEVHNLRLSVQSFTKETASQALRIGGTGEIIFSIRNPSHLELTGLKENASIQGLTALREETVFTWKPGLDAAESYDFILWKKEAGGALKAVSQQKTSKPSAKVSRLTEGSYQWTVNGRTRTGLRIDAVNPRHFTVNAVPLLPKAVMKAPEAKAVIGPKYLKSNRAIIFEWNKVEGATDYKFELFQKLPDGKLKKIESQEKLRSSSVKFKKLEKLDVGSFEWQVTAFSHAKDGYEEQKGLISVSSFNIQFAEPDKVQTVDPGIMYGE